MFDGFANWTQDHGNQHTNFKKHINILATLMTNPCKIDARYSNAKNIEVDAKIEVEIHRQNMKKQYKKKSRKMMQKESAQKLYAQRGPWAQSARRSKEFLWRL